MEIRDILQMARRVIIHSTTSCEVLHIILAQPIQTNNMEILRQLSNNGTHRICWGSQFMTIVIYQSAPS